MDRSQIIKEEMVAAARRIEERLGDAKPHIVYAKISMQVRADTEQEALAEVERRIAALDAVVLSGVYPHRPSRRMS